MMCGMAGMVANTGVYWRSPQAMSWVLEHRGPDGFGYSLYSRERGVQVWHNQEISTDERLSGTVGFVHRRLAIIDLSNDGLQPMTDDNHGLLIVYNGEIYNYLELRAELEEKGYRFQTNTDTEVLLKAYRAWGPACLRRFNGMWAFALLDVEKRTLFLARDRFGIKPLYYTLQSGRLLFASEIKALLAVSDVSAAPNEKIVAHYLLTGLVDHTVETFFDGIYQFPAAHWAEISLDSPVREVKPQAYWSLPVETLHLDEAEIIQRFRSLFLDALQLHARSDVAVGTCLSGGLDSSSIVCGADILRQRNLIPRYTHAAYGYCAADETYSERTFMQAVSNATNARMNYIEVSPDVFLETLPHIVQAQDEPFGSASIGAQWFVFQRARQTGMKVMLDGQGADEILGGYHYYFSTIARSLLQRGRFSSLFSLRNEYSNEIGPFPFRFNPISLVHQVSPRYLQELGRFVRFWWAAQGFVRDVANFGNIVLSKNFMRSQVHSLPKVKLPASLDEHLRADVQTFSLPALLRYEDRNSMAHSIEARVPFLDYRLVEFLFQLPENMKIRGATTKYILRQALQDVLPPAVLDRKDKIGFKAEADFTFEFARRYRAGLVKNKNDYERQWFDPARVDMALSCSERFAEFDVWRFINIKLWARHFWGGA